MSKIYPHLLRYWDFNEYRYYYTPEHKLPFLIGETITKSDIEFCKSCENKTPCNIDSCPQSPFYVIKEKEKTHVFFPFPIHGKLQIKAKNARLPYNRIEGFSFFNNEIAYESIESKLFSIFLVLDNYLTNFMLAFYNAKIDSLWINWKENEPLDTALFQAISLNIEDLPLSVHSSEIIKLYFYSNQITYDSNEPRKDYDKKSNTFTLLKKEDKSVEDRLDQIEKRYDDMSLRLENLEKKLVDKDYNKKSNTFTVLKKEDKSVEDRLDQIEKLYDDMSCRSENLEKKLVESNNIRKKKNKQKNLIIYFLLVLLGGLLFHYFISK